MLLLLSPAMILLKYTHVGPFLHNLSTVHHQKDFARTEIHTNKFHAKLYIAQVPH